MRNAILGNDLKSPVLHWRPVSSDSIRAFTDSMKICEREGLRTAYGFRANSVTRTNFVVIYMGYCDQE